jgi:hypothetical protein
LGRPQLLWEGCSKPGEPVFFVQASPEDPLVFYQFSKRWPAASVLEFEITAVGFVIEKGGVQ